MSVTDDILAGLNPNKANRMYSKRSFRRIILLSVSLLSACAAAEVTPSGVSSAPEAALPPVTGAMGAFLGGRHAMAVGDDSLATDLFLRGLKQEPANPDLARQAFVAALLAGRPEALELAHRQADDVAARMLLGNAEAKAGRWAESRAAFQALPRQGITQLLQPLLVAWSLQGEGKTEEALASLRPLMQGQAQFRPVFALHTAMIADLAGREDEAAKDYRIAQSGFNTTNLQLARLLASFQARHGHAVEAQQSLSQLLQVGGDLAVSLPALYARSAEPQVRNAADGMADAYLAMAGGLRGQDTGELTLILVRLALDLRPDLTAARLLGADVLDAAQQPKPAIAVLAPVPDTDPLVAVVRLRQAGLLARPGETGGDAAAALAVLERLQTTIPDRPEPFALKGDILRGQKKFTEAVAAYDKAVALLPRVEPGNWPLFYERGVALEQSQNWPRAEADFKRALELSPDQPMVLNYLGYSWTEQGLNLPQARRMIEKAVELRPNDGAIIDSLGWVIFRQGDTRKAVALLEKAVELTPSDATVNLHLGDAYWAVGRKLEAQFQWRRALTLNPEPEEVPKLQAKLRESEAALGNVPAARHAP